MKENTGFKFILRLALTLLAITGIMAAALALVNNITAPVIEKINAEKTQAAIEHVLPGGGDLVDFTDDTGLVEAVYASETGYAVQVAPSGFGGAIKMMVGVDKAGNVLAIDIISHLETSGLGSVAAEDSAKGEAFRSQFEGQSGTLVVGQQIDAISGATITSKAVTEGVNAALSCVANFG